MAIGGPQSKVDAFAKDFNSETITKSNRFDVWPDELKPYLGQDNINPKALNFNQKWINGVIDSNLPIYNLGRSQGYSPFYNGIEMNTIINRNYFNTIQVKSHGFYKNNFRVTIW
ncbi:hypothetical protein [Costertonia aggregata]|uniref:Uncharacterized protein n=1 Tax=Costertonia aggregata TaxID=343403 RepID=A0A7H9AN70_9FLAO|nr:hypothetical protein [Costertonia aggregata]QLG44902.1 hypothetical protein HYG79_05890 [Costertonia aggregata]